MAHSAQEQPGDSALIRSAKQAALDMGTEDLYGFWELFWTMRADFPDVDDELLLNASQQALADLVHRKLVRVVWWDPTTDADTEITPDEAVTLMQDRHHWEPPTGRLPLHVRFIATKMGEHTYYANVNVDTRLL